MVRARDSAQVRRVIQCDDCLYPGDLFALKFRQALPTEAVDWDERVYREVTDDDPPLETNEGQHDGICADGNVPD